LMFSLLLSSIRANLIYCIHLLTKKNGENPRPKFSQAY